MEHLNWNQFITVLMSAAPLLLTFGISVVVGGFVWQTLLRSGAFNFHWQDESQEGAPGHE